jgi:hypothetical protein
MMSVALMAVLCHVSPGPSGVCVEEIVIVLKAIFPSKAA